MHWGYYLFPRNRQNGFNGYIDQLSLIAQQGTFVDAETFTRLVMKSTLCDNIASKLNVELNSAIVLGEIDKLIGYEDAVVQKDKQLTDAQNKTVELEGEVLGKEIELKSLQEQMKTLTDKAQKLSDTVDIAVTENNILSEEIDKLKKDCSPTIQFTGWRQFILELLKKI